MVSFMQKVANVTVEYLLGVLKTPKRYLEVTLATFCINETIKSSQIPKNESK